MSIVDELLANTGLYLGIDTVAGTAVERDVAELTRVD